MFSIIARSILLSTLSRIGDAVAPFVNDRCHFQMATTVYKKEIGIGDFHVSHNAIERFHMASLRLSWFP